MLEIAIPILLVLLLIVAMKLQKTEERKYAGLVYAGMAIAHHIIMYFADGWLYYFSAAAVDALVVFFTLRLRIMSPVIESIHAICYVSIAVNAFGWVIWRLELPPDSYNAAFLLIYSWAIITLLRKERGDATRDTALGMGHHYVFTAPGKSDNSNSKQAD